MHLIVCGVTFIRCGDTTVLTRAIIGRLPMLDAASETGC
jgi:hypothetical protein